jgi:decaprenyl-phosphate phosphoribosyltransferase
MDEVSRYDMPRAAPARDGWPAGETVARCRLVAGRLADYVRIARPDHWIKNIFVLPGFAVAVALVPHASLSMGRLAVLGAGLVSVCLAASANYTINEFLDARYDRHHPLKRTRPGARGVLDPGLVWLQYVVLTAAALLIAASVDAPFLTCTLWLLLMGIGYNVAPFRTKDRAYLDVLSESINNPIRFLLGWFIMTAAMVPPASALLAYWMGGAFLMAVKRYSEFRRIGDPAQAAMYRRSFGQYSETSLLLSAFFFAMCSAFFIGIFLIKYRIGLILTFPLFAALFTWYLAIGLRRDSAAQQPEKLYREVPLLCFAAVTFLATVVLFVFQLPMLNGLTETQLIRLP